MAVTTEITTNIAAAKLPDGYTPPSTTITFSGTPIEESFTFSAGVSGVYDASTPGTTMANILSAVKTYVDNTYIPSVLKLDATETINGIIYVDRIQRKNSNSNEFLLGTDSYYVRATLKYE